MLPLILHLLGDYVLQSDWMANNKTSSHKAAAAHAITYSIPFLVLSPSVLAFAVILITHFFIDRYRLARFVVYAKEQMLSPMPSRAPAVPFDQQTNPSLPSPVQTSPLSHGRIAARRGIQRTNPIGLRSGS